MSDLMTALACLGLVFGVLFVSFLFINSAPAKTTAKRQDTSDTKSYDDYDYGDD